MLEKWKKALDKGESVCTTFMDLSKAVDSINHDLLLVKLKTYGFSKNALKSMSKYIIISVRIRKFRLVCRKDLLMVHFCLTYL